MTGCPFCAIVAGDAPATIVRDWTDALAFVPLAPVTPGHVLVVPKLHVEDAAADPGVTASTMLRAAQFIAAVPIGCNLITSVGRAATQSVFHLHVHVVPRREGDGLHLPWTGQDKLAWEKQQGAILECGCWTHRVPAGMSIGERFRCLAHGPTAVARTNVDEP